MSTPNHALAGFAIGRWFSLPLEQCFVIALAGMSPDIIGWVARVIGDSRSWHVYNLAHDSENFAYGCVAVIAISLFFGSVIPAFCTFAYGLHLLLDWQTHGEGKRWWVWNERLYLEILSWVILITYLLYSYKIL